MSLQVETTSVMASIELGVSLLWSRTCKNFSVTGKEGRKEDVLMEMILET